jgi:hypothetical protein
MAKQQSVRRLMPAGIDRATLKDLLRDLHDTSDDARLDQILALHPTLAEVEEAILWLDGKANAMLGHGRLPAPATIGIVSILAGDEEERPTAP